MDAKIKVIIKRADEEYGHVTNISQRLENLQKTVGGYIETVTIAPGLVIICNEDGRSMGLPENCTVTTEEISVDFVGDIIVAGVSGDTFDDVPISLKEWKAMVM